MENQKYIVIFSHGFGTKKDDNGLFSGDNGISESLQREGIETILFDYNSFNESDNTMEINPLSVQVEALKKIIEEAVAKNPGAIIDIIAHSQGCLVPALLLPKNIRQAVFVAPSLNSNNQRMIDYFKDRPKTKIDFEGISHIGRQDGTVSIVPSQYWKDREKADPILLYNNFSKLVKIVIIKANQDTTLGDLSTEGLSSGIVLLKLDGNHNFDGAGRTALIESIKEILCK